MEVTEGKKIILEELSKEELIKKCRRLISFAQKAKASKEALQEDNNVLNNKLQNATTGEVVEALNTEKLTLVMQIQDLRVKNKTIEEKYKLLKEAHISSQHRLTDLDTENVSIKRQLARLTDENEQLILDLSTLEAQIAELHKLGVKQKGRLLELEMAHGKGLDELQGKLSFNLEEVQKLNDTLVVKENEILNLLQELQALRITRTSPESSTLDSNKNCDNCAKEISELKSEKDFVSQELIKIQLINDKLKEKVALYHSKLKKFALTTKEIKDQKNDILKLFKAHVEQTNDWKEQLCVSSEQLFIVFNDLKNENKLLKDKIESSQIITTAENRDLIDKLQTSEKEITNYKNKEKINLDQKFQDINSALSECKMKEIALIEELSLKTYTIEEVIRIKTLLEDENKKLSKSCRDYQEQLNNLTKQLNHKDETLNHLEQSYQNEMQQMTHSLFEKNEEVNKLNKALEQSTNFEKRFAEESTEEILRLAKCKKELEEKITALQERLYSTERRTFADSFVQTINDNLVFQNLTDDGIDLKRENSELLLEMNQMNQALKERGEIISQLESYCDEIRKKLQIYESQENKNVDLKTEKDEIIKALQNELQLLQKQNSIANLEIASLKAELMALKDTVHSHLDNSYPDSETMSTSTISRCEEVSQLKDLEESWEERYGKLRTLAIKLKAKVRDQINIINGLEKKNDDLIKKHSSCLKSSQSLQLQVDQLQDSLEQVNNENKQYVEKLNIVAQNISKDKQLLVVNDETISKLKNEIDILLGEKQSVENWKKQVSAKVQTLRKELEVKTLLFKESETKVSKLENELENISSQLKIEQEAHKQTKNLLEQSSTECKKNSVLNLEMQDYERSVKELTQKIEKQSSEISSLQTQLDLQRNTVNALRNQNKILQEKYEENEKNRDSFSIEINTCKKTISNLENLLEQKENKILSVTKLLETVRFENDELSTELSKVIAEHQKSLVVFKSERDQLRNQLLALQQNLRDSQEHLQLRDGELGAIKGDYESYKVRAQSVLKKNQSRDLGLEEKLSEDLTSSKSKVDQLNEELKFVRDKLENEEVKNNKLIAQNEQLSKKLYELELEVEELRNCNEQLKLKHQRALSENAEKIRNLKVYAETLSQCYRQQLNEQEIRHNREIVELQSRIEKPSSPETVEIHPNLQREEGEGSESVESSPLQNNVHPIPLERLLDSKDDEVMHLQKSIVEQESKIKHLTALLSDTEQDLAKHIQMTNVLKEEIRRHQRSVEREKHAENLEYLKNVVFKFITLNSGDERTRLVPVLNTILKLSPEETQKITMVAKGDARFKVWSNYLPLWSPNAPQ